MEIGIVGLGQSGKSTLFKIMTGVDSSTAFGEKYVEGIAKVPDSRFDKLVEIFKPKKVSPAQVKFIDVNASGENAWDSIRQTLNEVDGIVHLVASFSAKDEKEISERYRKLEDELIFSDMVAIENRLARLAKSAGKNAKPEDAIHLKILPKAKELLEAGKPLREMSITAQELQSIKGFSFWTIRPEIVVLNKAEGAKDQTELVKDSIAICCQVESEISALPKEDQKEFLESMNITTPAYERIIRSSFFALGKISYFTVGEDEVKAWVVQKDSFAPKAAAAIHKDFERGFIKAEVVSYNDFIACGGSLAGAKSAGKLRLEGKEYVVQDGDIINFRFNV